MITFDKSNFDKYKDSINLIDDLFNEYSDTDDFMNKLCNIIQTTK